jgi:hypothetical protein
MLTWAGMSTWWHSWYYGCVDPRNGGVSDDDGLQQKPLGESVKTALILGITGQDGAYLAHLLLGKVSAGRLERTAMPRWPTPVNP